MPDWALSVVGLLVGLLAEEVKNTFVMIKYFVVFNRRSGRFPS